MGWKREEGGCAILIFGEVGGNGVGVGEFTITFIKYFRYLLSRARCSQNFNEPHQYNVGTTSAIFCTSIFLLE